MFSHGLCLKQFLNKNRIFVIINQYRSLSQSEKSNKRLYTDTVKLPKTDFPLTLKESVVVQRELDIQKVEYDNNFLIR